MSWSTTDVALQVSHRRRKLDVVEHIAPLLQTMLWVGLIAGIVIRFNHPLHELLNALHKRIAEGSDLEAGPFKLTLGFKPQPPAQQVAKAEAELADSAHIREEAPALPRSPNATSVARSRYFQAEDLALRAIQLDFGTPVLRQVTTGADRGFDGAFERDGVIHIVEVKYYQSWANTVKLRDSIAQLTDSLLRFRASTTRIVLAIVFEQPAAMERNRPRITEALALNRIPVDVRFFAMPELVARFEGQPTNEG